MKKALPPPFEFGKTFPGLITMLLKDHKAMKKLMAQIKSPRASASSIKRHYATLKKLVYSHMQGEELALLNPIITHPKFADQARESYEEHRIHEHIFEGIGRLKNRERQLAQMKIYCEILEHHLKEEERDLFPQYKKYFALSSRKKAGKKFLGKRQQTAGKGGRPGVIARR